MNQQNSLASPPPKKKKNVFIITLICSLLAIIIALTATLVIVLNHNDGSYSDDDNSDEPTDMPQEEPLVEDDTLKIGYTIYEPMNYIENGALTGFDTEFAEAVCEKLGMTPEFIEINWDTKFQTLNAGQIDCIWNGMTISDDVKANCLVSIPYVKNAQVVVMNEDIIDNYTDVESLKGLTLTAEAGSAGESEIYAYELNENYVASATEASALLAVKAGQADACVIYLTMAKAMTDEGTDFADLDYNIEFSTEEYGIGFRLDDTELRDAVNSTIYELFEDGTMAYLADKYNLTLCDY